MNTRQHSVFARQFLAAALVSLGVAFPAIADDIQPLSAYSYATNGLIGWWDGEFNSLDANGVPIHKSNATQWVSLVGGGTDGVFGPTNTLKFGEKSVTLRGSRIQTTLARLPTSYSGHCLTVQIVAKCVKSGDSSPDEMFSSWHGNLRINKAGSFVANEGTYTIANKTRVAYALNPGIDLSQPQICTVAFLSDSMEVNVNAKDMTVASAGTSGTMDPNQNFYIGSVRGRSDDKDPCHFEYYSVRVYDRKLDKDEIIRNAILDARRFGIDSLFAQPLALPITKDSYVQDGLYSQWDGVYNNLVDGKPTHVASPTQWDDLKGNATPFATSGAVVYENGKPTETPCYVYKDDRVVVRQNQVRVVVPMIPGDYHPWTMECAAFCSEEHQNDAIDSMFASSKYGNLGWRNISGGFRIHGTALAGELRGYSGAETPKESDCPSEDNRTYSYTFANYGATLALDGTRVSYTIGTGMADAPDNGEFAVGSSRGKTDATTPCAFDFYSLRIYDRPLSLTEQRQNHFVDSVRFFGAPVTTNLVVTGEPRCVGVVSPNYGCYCNVKVDDLVVCSAPTNAKSYRLLGYEVQTNGVKGTWHPWLSGTGSSFRFFQPALAVKVVWKWRSPGLAVIIQ